MTKLEKLVGIAVVREFTGWSTATINRKVKAGLFPQPLRFGSAYRRWKMSDLSAWLDAAIELSRLKGS